MLRSLLVSLVLVSTLLGCCVAFQTRFQLNNANITKLVVFGDDYSDMGNVYNLTEGLFPNPSEYNDFVGPVCNGDVWWVQMNEHFLKSNLQYSDSSQVQNFAYIGAGLNSVERPGASHLPGNPSVVVPGLQQQVEAYWQTEAASTPSGTLFISFAGTNELLVSGVDFTSPTFFPSLIQGYITTILTNQQACFTVGVECSYLVVGLLQIGGSPYLYNLVGNQTDHLNSLVNIFNANLRAAILSIKYNPASPYYSLFANVQWVDPTAEYARMAGKPGQYGFLVDGGPLQGHEDAFCAPLGETTHCKNVDDYYWWNQLYLSKNAHYWFGNKIFNEAFIQGEEKFYGYF